MERQVIELAHMHWRLTMPAIKTDGAPLIYYGGAIGQLRDPAPKVDELRKGRVSRHRKTRLRWDPPAVVEPGRCGQPPAVTPFRPPAQ
jgi:hypothetical protein